MCVANIPDKLTEYLKNIRHMQLLHKTDLQSPNDSMKKKISLRKLAALLSSKLVPADFCLKKKDFISHL